MTDPIVTVTRTPGGETRAVEWFEDEDRAYAGDPFIRLVFNPVWCSWDCQTLRTHGVGVGWQAAITQLRLKENPFVDVSDVATHYYPEPGAPLEPLSAPITRTLGGAA